jgi:hypothetical protein
MKHLGNFLQWLSVNPLTPSARLLWYTLEAESDRQNGLRENLRFTVATLESLTGNRPAAIRKAVGELKKSGLIRAKSESGKSGFVITFLGLENLGNIKVDTKVDDGVDGKVESKVDTKVEYKVGGGVGSEDLKPKRLPSSLPSTPEKGKKIGAASALRNFITDE